MEQEIFKEIEWSCGKYSVSNKGRVRNNKSGKILKQCLYENGYLGVNMNMNGKIFKKRVHRLVAEMFIRKPNENEQVNHKDEIKTNNSADNLEWVTSKENINYGTRTARISKALSVKIDQLTIGGEYSRNFDSAISADRSLGGNGNGSNIIKVCKGNRKSYKGYKWKYSI